MRPSVPAHRLASAASPSATSRDSTKSRTSSATVASALSAAASTSGARPWLPGTPLLQYHRRRDDAPLESLGREPHRHVRQRVGEIEAIRIVGVPGADEYSVIGARASEEIGDETERLLSGIAHQERRQPRT